MAGNQATDSPLRRTPLYDLHVARGGRIVPFAGYEMPVQFAGIMAEHNYTRQAAGLFDVSHMGQAFLVGPDHATTAAALERLVPGEIAGLAPGSIRYTQFTTPDGGIIDDLMVTRSIADEDDGRLMLVVNAAREDVDYAWLREHLPAAIALQTVDDRALIALQGPQSETVLSRHCADAAGLSFMTAISTEVAGIDCHISRSGYSGEDGYEISVPEARAVELAETLLAEPEVEPVGLGARDSLRLEAGLCLYGHDIDETTSPVEAQLVWSIGKRRRAEGGFIGAERIQRELAEGPARKRAGIRPDGRAPAREGTEIVSPDGTPLGTVTSGGFGPTVGGPVAMGYVTSASAAEGTAVHLMVRGNAQPATIARLPFITPGYKR